MRKIYISFLAAMLAMSLTTAAAGAAHTASEEVIEDIADDLAADEVFEVDMSEYEEDVIDDIAVITPEFTATAVPATTLPDIVDDTMYEEDILPDEAPIDFNVEPDDNEDPEDFATSTPEEFEEHTTPPEPYVYPDSIDGWGVSGNGTEEVLEKYYGKFGYPEYISYVYNTGAESLASEEYEDYNIVFWYHDVALVENTPENQQAVLDIAAENCYIRFVDAKWSYNQRKAVYDELEAMDIDGMRVKMPSNIETIFVYLPDDSEHFDDIPLHDGMVKVVPESEILENDDSYDIGGTVITGTVPGIGGYNDGAVILETGIAEELTTGVVDEQQNGLPMWAWFGIAVIAFVAVGGAILLIRKNRVSVNTDGSAEVTATAKNDVVKMISDSTEKPSDELKDKIMRELDK